ncbi:hypothetical protein [Acidovorax sp. SUPP3334]|uniref:hypothetical protein n=1 Tax=Acidovorax sp. SUPP3334 TaxID=2920881 RepID=UPI0023DE6362|nr:hypothetical protein [Acidovorax sp. SUPP3334]GKT26889.1 hypothetical protein AVHM3334_22320 [Acidovorax sp. SUPP3334]
MSLFLAYFEEKNPTSSNYQGFKDVGKFNIPKEINAGTVRLIYKGKTIEATLISDKSRQSINYIFIKKDIQSRIKLINFIQSRTANSCIIINIVGYIEGSKNTEVKLLKKIFIKDIDNFLEIENFSHMQGLTIGHL